jgi:hypothetical protein
MLKTLPPDSPDRATYERVAQHYGDKLGTPAANDMAGAFTSGGMAGLAASFGAQAKGVEGAASRERSRENAIREQDAAARLYTERRDTRLAGEQFGKDMTGASRDIERERAKMIEAEVLGQRAKAEADSATARARSNPAYIQREQDIRMAEQEGRLATAQGESRITQGQVNADVAQTERVQAFQQYGVDPNVFFTQSEGELTSLGNVIGGLVKGRVSGNMFGNADGASKIARSFLTNRVGVLERMAQTHPGVARDLANQILTAPVFPDPNAEGEYTADAGGNIGVTASTIVPTLGLSAIIPMLPQNVSGRNAVASDLTSAYQKLRAIAGQSQPAQ